MSRQYSKALRILILCTALWGLSFPAMKALVISQERAIPDAGSWFLASLAIVYRFGISALIMLLFSWRTLRSIRPAEIKQGLGLGLFGGVGILLQMDGLAYTSASTSAFLTQCYCVFIPIWIALRERRRPSGAIVLGCLCVVAGVAVLSDLSWSQLRLGRGELETIAGSVLFTGQILWLDSPKYGENRTAHFSLIMFATITAVCAPVALLTAPRLSDCWTAYQSISAKAIMAILIGPCTFGAYLLMNRWQRHVTATHAGLIYCLEPVFASAYALFLPEMLSRWTEVNYHNEKLTASLLVGGTLITLANVFVHAPWASGRNSNPTPAPFQGNSPP